MKLDAHHQATVDRIFRHPAAHNLAWHDVVSLLEGLDALEVEHDGRLRVALGPEVQVFTRHGRDLDEAQVVDLRRMLRGAGVSPQGA